MSDDEADPELLELLRKSLGISAPSNEISPDTKVLRHAEFIYGNSIDVAIDMRGTVAAAAMIREQMQQRSYSTKAWAEHELHPKAKDEATANFIFTMDLLNFSFWSELDEEQRFSVVYRGKRWTGYWSLVACLQRALDEGIPITSPWFWSTPTSGEPLVVDEARAVNGEVHQDDHLANHAIEDEVMQHQPADEAPVYSTLAASDSMDLEASHLQAVQAGSDEAEDVDTNTINAKVDNKQLTAKLLAHVFRSATEEQIPMFSERLECLREAGAVLRQHFVGSVLNLIQSANGSAGMLVNLLSYHFDCFRDETTFDRRIVQIMKRAQIFVADLWAAFDGQGCGEFYDIDKITMFAGLFNLCLCIALLTVKQITECLKCCTAWAVSRSVHLSTMQFAIRDYLPLVTHGKCNYEAAASGA